MKAILFILLLSMPGLIAGQSPRLMLPVGHTATITSIAFSPDGNQVLTTDENFTTILWQTKTGKPLLIINDNAPGGLFLAPDMSNPVLSPNGKYILAASKVWDINTAEKISKLKSDISPTAAAFSPDSKYIATAFLSWQGEGNITIWNPVTGESKETFQVHSGTINSVTYSPDGKFILTASTDGTAKVWNVAAKKNVAILRGGDDDDELMNAAFSANGKYILTATEDNTVNIWRGSNFKLIKKLSFDGKLQKAVFSPACPDDPAGGKYIATIAKGDLPRIWLSENGSLVNDTEKGDLDNSNIIFSPDGKYLATSSYNNVSLWQIPSGKFLYNVNEHNGIVNEKGISADRLINSIQFSPDGNYLAIGDDITGKVLKVKNDELVTYLRGSYGGFNMSGFTTDDSLILTRGKSRLIWDINTGQIKSEHGSAETEPGKLKSSDGKYTLVAEEDAPAKIIETNTGRTISLIRDYKKSDEDPGFFSPDNKFLVIGCKDKKIRQWLVKTGALVTSFSGALLYSYEYSTLTAYNAGNKCLIETDKVKYSVLDLTSGNIISTLKAKVSGFNFDNLIRSAVFSPPSATDPLGGKYVLTISYLGKKTTVWNANTGDEVSVLKDDTKNSIDEVSNAVFSKDGNYIITNSNYNGLKKWHTKTGILLNTSIPVDHGYDRVEKVEISDDKYMEVSETDSTEVINLTPKGFYQCSQNGAKLLHYVRGLQTIGFDQLDVKYNRPDKVLESIGNTDTALINAYRRAYLKRIEKLGIDTSFFNNEYNVPEADFENRGKIEPEQHTEILHLILKANDSQANLDRYNIWINEVPLYGQRGVNIRSKNSRTINSLPVDVKLSQGKNKIEFSVFNTSGIESYRQPIVVNYIPATPKQEKVYFIGIGINRFASDNNPLYWCVSDIRDLASKLKEKYGNNFVLVDMLFNEKVTLDNIRELKKKLQQTGINDKLIIAYSGHGLLSSKYDYYLSGYNVNFKNPEEGGIPYGELEGLMDDIPARKKLLLLDACNSGEVDKGQTNQNTGGKGVIVSNTNKLGLASSFELMRQLFVNVNKGTGATVIAAAQGYQSALEQNNLGHGVFTYAVLDALSKNSSMKISELKKWVGDKVQVLTGGKQKPTTRNEPADVDWIVW